MSDDRISFKTEKGFKIVTVKPGIKLVLEGKNKENKWIPIALVTEPGAKALKVPDKDYSDFRLSPQNPRPEPKLISTHAGATPSARRVSRRKAMRENPEIKIETNFDQTNTLTDKKEKE